MSNRYTDLSLKEGDLYVENGQLVISKDEELIKESLLRRILTPINVYAKAVSDFNTGTLTIVDQDYGNPSYDLTAIDSQIVVEKLKDELTHLLRDDPRVEVVSIDITSDIMGEVQTVINYYIKDFSDLQTININ